MPIRMQTLFEMSRDTSNRITSSDSEWMRFLQTAAKLYKYPFPDQLMIYAQKPDASACADYKVWTERMRRYVRHGARGIALLDYSGDRPVARYVFDVSDTSGDLSLLNPNLWKYNAKEHQGVVAAALEARFGVHPGHDLIEQMDGISRNLAISYWRQHQQEIFSALDGSSLAEYDRQDVYESFVSAVSNSMYYAVLSRCGLEPEKIFQYEDFMSVFDFDTPYSLSALGMAVSQCTETVLRQIEVTVKRYERAKNAERSAEHGEQPDIQTGGGLPDSRSGPVGTLAPESGQVRTNAPEIPARTQADSVGDAGGQRGPVSAPSGSRGRGEQAAGRDDAAVGESGGRNGGTESVRPNAVGRPDERLQGAGGGNHPVGTGVRLTSQPEETAAVKQEPEAPEPVAPGAMKSEIVRQTPGTAAEPVRQKPETARTSPAKPKPTAAKPVAARKPETQGTQFSLFPPDAHQNHQEHYNPEAESAAARSASLISQDVMDNFLRVGSNTENARMKIVTEYAKHNPEIAAFLKQTYHGGYGLRVGYGAVSAWAMEDGIHFARGNRARYVENAEVLPWQDVMRRINQLLAEGRFATNVELAEAPGYERHQIAQSLIYLSRDLSEEAVEQGYLPNLRALRGGFPDIENRLVELLENPETRAPIVTEYRQFVTAWHMDRNLLRFRYHSPAELLRRLNELNEPRREFHSDMTELPRTEAFITEDEISDVFQSESLDTRVKTYQFWQEKHSAVEKAKFLRELHGESGHSNAISGEFRSWVSFKSKGVEFRKPACSDVQLKWSEVANRIDTLIADGHYVTPEELDKYRTGQQEERQRAEQIEAASIPDAAAKVAEVSDVPAEIEYLTPILHSIDWKMTRAFTVDYFREHPAERDRIQYLKRHLGEGVGNVSLKDGTSLWFQAQKDSLVLWMKEEPSNLLHYSWEDVCRLAADIIGVSSSKETVLQGYAAVKLEHGDDIVLYQEGDRFELYGQDAELAAPLLGVELETRPALQGEGTVPYCAIPVNNLDASVQALRDQYDVTVSGLTGTERQTVSFLSVDHEAERYIDAHEAEFGADGTRVFSDPAERQTAGDSPAAAFRPVIPSPAAPVESASPAVSAAVPSPSVSLNPQQADIDNALRQWNGNPESRQAVARYMADHARERDTAAWLSREFDGGKSPAFHVEMGDTAVIVPWPKAQRRLAQLIQQNQFLLPEERAETAPTREAAPAAVPPAQTAPEWDPLAPPYHVGDTVYLDGTPFEIKAVHRIDLEVYNAKLGYRDVQIRDLERLLFQDTRNSQITDYLGADLRNYNSDWEGILTGDGGLLGLTDKADVVRWIRAHESNARIAQRLSDGYAGRSGVIAAQSIPVNAQSYSTTKIGLEVHYQGNYNGTLKFSWVEVARILRTKFQREREAFYRDPGTEPSVTLTGTLHYGRGDTVFVPLPEGEIIGTITAVGSLDVQIEVDSRTMEFETVNRRRFEEAIRHDERNAGLFLPEGRETVGTRETVGNAAPAASARPTESARPAEGVTSPPPSAAVRSPAADAPSAPARPAASSGVSQADIDDALRRWNGNMDSKRAVVRYMADHARERDTAAWLSREYDGGKAPAFHVEAGGTSADVPWPRVQRRLAQLIQRENFFTPEELDNLENIDPVAIREGLAQHGIVNGEVVDPAALENSPFIQQVEADAAQAAARETAREESAEPSPVDAQPQTVLQMEPVERPVRDGTAPEVPPVIEVEGVVVPEPTETQQETESAAVPASQEQPQTAYTPQDFQPYKVGDTVWLDNHAFQITEIRYSTIQLLDPALAYPIYRAESRERFEQLLRQDRRNSPITEFLPLSPKDHYLDLMDALTGDEGLLNERHKEIIAGWFRARESNSSIAHRLSETFAGTRETMLLHTGEWMDYFATTVGLNLEIQDKFSTKYSFRWYEAAQVLRSLYQDERGGFSHEPKPKEPVRLEGRPVYQVGDHVVVPYPDRDVEGTIGYVGENQVRIDTGPYSWSNVIISVPQFEEALRQDERNAGLFVLDVREPVAEPQSVKPEDAPPENAQPNGQPEISQSETDRPGQSAPDAAFYPGEKTGLPYDVVIQTIPTPEQEREPQTAAGQEIGNHAEITGGQRDTGRAETTVQPEPADSPEAAEIKIPAKENFRITDDHLGEGSQREKFRANMSAIYTLKAIEAEGRSATKEEQEILSRYVGWGGLPNVFDPDKAAWNREYQELKAALTEEEYRAANASVLNAHYTSPTVIKAVYEAIENMGFKKGNILEPSCGIGNFLGLLPESMSQSNLFGVELDSITGRIAQQLYPKARILVRGYERADYPKDFFDLAVGNVPFGNFQVFDPAYSKLKFSIHNYFFAKALDQVRPGGVVAFVTSRYTMDSQSPDVRQYLAKRAKLLGAIRLPNDAFKANAGTEVVTDILFLQKNDAPVVEEPEWVQTGANGDGFTINRYFLRHPEMVLGNPASESTQYGHQDYTVNSIPGSNLADLLREAVSHIHGEYKEAELPDLGEDEPVQNSIPADPNVRNYSYTLVNGEVYFRENSVMVRPDLSRSMEDRVKGMVELRDCVHRLIDLQMNGTDTMAIYMEQRKLNKLYDAFTEKYGLLNNRANSAAFSADSAYYLLCSLEVLDEDGNLQRKADMFTKRTIKAHTAATSVDTPAEALAVSIGERAKVDMPYMMRLCGKSEEEITAELRGVIFFNHESLYDSRQEKYLPADEYLSGNVRRKLEELERAATMNPDMDFSVNIAAMQQAQPKDLDASEIDVRLGATWVDKKYIQQFMYETFKTSWNDKRHIRVNYSEYTSQWNITEKGRVSGSDVMANFTYGTSRINAYHILEDTLNLRDVRIYDLKKDPDTGKDRRVLNLKETTLAQQKQQAMRNAFKDWIWKDPYRRQDLVRTYNQRFNAVRPREYDGRHITFSGINPEITLREHQLNAIARQMYGGNTLLAHEVGAGKTFEMVAAAMESKRLGLCQKCLFVVPNHLIEQWASEFLRLYPAANILVTTKRDFEKRNRKKFCARIATGDYDAIIMGHSQFERIPVSYERRERLLRQQIHEVKEGLDELRWSGEEKFSVKQLERTLRSLEARLEKLMNTSRKDDVVTFEQLGVDRLFVDEAHGYKNLFLYTKMYNVAGLATTDALKSSDMLLKCRYLDEITHNKGVVFATGTPVSNSMTELFTMQRYLQHEELNDRKLAHFDNWVSVFGETTSNVELAPEGDYRVRNRLANFYNLPELMAMFREIADIKTAEQLRLPAPEVEYHVVKAQPTNEQRALVEELSQRADRVHHGIDPKIDNMLKITSDGRKLGLDQRLINPDFPDNPASKVNMCVNNIVQIWQDGQADKLTQLVFCDLSTPKGKSAATKDRTAMRGGNRTAGGTELHALGNALAGFEPDAPFSVYEDIRDKLIERGIPAQQIAFIHDADTDQKKKELFAKVRSGQVRVLMGSTFKMGAGTNVQDRLIALHDLDCPWRPGDLEQRKGRIARQGNMNPKVHVYRYVTEATFDSYLWQTVEKKQRFIAQIMTSNSPVRSCSDIDETTLSYAEIKALCAGNPLIKERMDLDNEITRLEILKKDHDSQQFNLQDKVLTKFPEEMKRNEEYIAGFQTDMATAEANPHPKDGFAGLTLRGDTLTDKDNAGAALLAAKKDVTTVDPVEIGSYRGFTLSMALRDFGRTYVLILKGQMSHTVEMGSDAKGNFIRMDNALAAIPQRIEAVKAAQENLRNQIEEAKAQLGKPFPHEALLREKKARLEEVDAMLHINDGAKGQGRGDEDAAKSARPSSVLGELRKSAPPAQKPEVQPKPRRPER